MGTCIIRPIVEVESWKRRSMVEMDEGTRPLTSNPCTMQNQHSQNSMHLLFANPAFSFAQHIDLKFTENNIWQNLEEKPVYTNATRIPLPLRCPDPIPLQESAKIRASFLVLPEKPYTRLILQFIYCFKARKKIWAMVEGVVNPWLLRTSISCSWTERSWASPEKLAKSPGAEWVSCKTPNTLLITRLNCTKFLRQNLYSSYICV